MLMFHIFGFTAIKDPRPDFISGTNYYSLINNTFFLSYYKSMSEVQLKKSWNCEWSSNCFKKKEFHLKKCGRFYLKQ